MLDTPTDEQVLDVESNEARTDIKAEVWLDQNVQTELRSPKKPTKKTIIKRAANTALEKYTTLEADITS